MIIWLKDKLPCLDRLASSASKCSPEAQQQQHSAMLVLSSAEVTRPFSLGTSAEESTMLGEGWEEADRSKQGNLSYLLFINGSSLRPLLTTTGLYFPLWPKYTMNLPDELWLELTLECLACKLCQYDVIKLVVNNDGWWTQMFVYWAFIAKVTATNLLKILFPHESFTSSVHLSIMNIRRLHAIASSSLLGVETMQALPVGLVFHSALKPPEECIKKWPIFNCIELWNPSCRFLLI